MAADSNCRHSIRSVDSVAVTADDASGAVVAAAVDDVHCSAADEAPTE